MLLLLTGIYVGFIWLIFYKLKLLEFTKARKIIVTVIGVAGLLYLIIALGRYMPSMSGAASVINASVEIRADVGGRVVKVWVTRGGPVKKGDPLFQVDPTTYQYEYDRARAALAQAKQQVRGMKATLDQARAAVEQARSARSSAESNVARVKARINAAAQDLIAAKADVAKTRASLETTESQAAMLRKAGESDAVSKVQLEEAQKRVESQQAQLAADRALEQRARVNLDETLPAELSGAEAGVRQAGDALAQAEAAAEKARLALESTIDGKHTMVRQAEESLALAKWNLEHTTVVAPDDGWIYSPQVREGAYVRIMDRVMAFTSKRDQWIMAPVGQFAAALIEPDAPVELTFPMYPGRIVHGKVVRVAKASGESQLTMSGDLPTMGAFAPAAGYMVRIELPEADPDRPLFPGMAGTAAVYTEYGSVLHIIRKVIIRMESWTNYLPF